MQIDTNANIISSNIVHKEDGHFYYNKRIGSNDYERVKITEENIYVLERYYRQCKSVPGLKRMVVRIKKMSSQMYESHCCVIYSLQASNPEEEVVILSHGNSTKLNDRLYIRTSSATLEREKELLVTNPGMCCFLSSPYQENFKENVEYWLSNLQGNIAQNKKRVARPIVTRSSGNFIK